MVMDSGCAQSMEDVVSTWRVDEGGRHGFGQLEEGGTGVLLT